MIKLGIIGPEKGPGQLGMLLAWEANKLHCMGEANFSIKTISSESSPEWSDENFGLEDLDFFVQNTQLITYETESLSKRFREAFESKLKPNLQALNIFSNRYQEKEFFQSLNFAIPSFYHLKSIEDVEKIIEQISKETNKKFRLKTCELGYDGHGQQVIEKPEKLRLAWPYLGSVECLLEEEINIFRELSIIGTRFSNGQIIYFPIPENIHHKGVLYRSRFCKISKKLQNTLQNSLKKFLDKLNYIGTFALEAFQKENKTGPLLFNEGAPRVHNSGHFTLNLCHNTNQFDAHIRAICGLPALEPVSKHQFFSMTNLLGYNPEQFENLKEKLKELADAELEYFCYWYNKAEARPMRKMGHITLLSDDLKKLENAEKIINLNSKL